ncbi:MAG: penicillin-binding protein 2 [Patescibacteria group bacterium]|nr:penicillin-binding protein 2 [Patescibacteria group bacterium]
MRIYTSQKMADSIFNKRLAVYSLGFLLFFLLVCARLFYWQVVKGDELSLQARKQYDWGKVLAAPRGNILAVDGSWLAASVVRYKLIANPSLIKGSIDSIVDSLMNILTTGDQKLDESKKSRIKNLLLNSKLQWVMLDSRLNEDLKRKIEDLKYPFLTFELEYSRYYPEDSIAAHLLGFVGKNEEGVDVGYFGLEGEYDLALSGKSGYIKYEKDALGLPILLRDSKEVDAANGVNLKTHIDKTIQTIVDKELKNGIERYGASSGNAIVLRPQDGAILAMSSYPSYDPAKYWEYGNEYFINPNVSYSFEPGSIFKVLVMAAGIDAGVIDSDTICEICGGPVAVDKYLIETWNKKYRRDSIMTDVLVNSDNVGMVFVARRLGIERMHEYLRKFGIGENTGIDLQGEVSPKLRDKSKWSIVDQATISFGQGVAVTPIQMVRAVGAIANEGKLMTPQVVDSLSSADWEKDILPVESRQVISQQSAKKISYMMAQAAKNGEAKWTFLRGFKVAGKTGTAQIPIEGHYDKEKTIASFIGFAPYDNPKFVMLVTLDKPSTSPWASETAAPLWYKIANQLFSYLKIPPDNQD